MEISTARDRDRNRKETVALSGTWDGASLEARRRYVLFAGHNAVIGTQGA